MSIYSNKGQVQRQLGQMSDGVGQDIAIVETILRDRRQFFEEIREEVAVPDKIRSMLISSAAFLAVYGAVLGSTHSLLQALSSAAKLPLLFLATMLVCLPTLYVFSILFGSNQRLSQTIALVLSAITITSALLLSFASITFFFMLTTSNYQFFKLLNVFFFIMAGIVGMSFLNQGRRIVAVGDEDKGAWKRGIVSYLWIFLFAFVGSQMAWTLRPFVGYPGANFEPLREIGGNFYANVFTSIGELLGLYVVM
jgi:hypothetical protein